MSVIFDYSNLIITTLFNHLCTRLGAYPPGSPHPDTLYVQADNCYAENKNTYVFSFLSLLTALDIFKDIYFSFLIVGHTHEDINQLFSTVQTKFCSASVHTPGYGIASFFCLVIVSLTLTCSAHSQLDTFLRSVYSEEGSLPKFSVLEQVWDWKAWLSNHMHGLSGHAAPHVFHFYKNADGKPEMRDKPYHCQGEWSDPYQLLSSLPVGTNSPLPTSLNTLPVRLPADLELSSLCFLCPRCPLDSPPSGS